MLHFAPFVTFCYVLSHLVTFFVTVFYIFLHFVTFSSIFVTFSSVLLHGVTFCYSSIHFCYMLSYSCCSLLHFTPFCYTLYILPHVATFPHTLLHFLTSPYTSLHFLTLYYTLLHCVIRALASRDLTSSSFIAVLRDVLRSQHRDAQTGQTQRFPRISSRSPFKTFAAVESRSFATHQTRIALVAPTAEKPSSDIVLALNTTESDSRRVIASRPCSPSFRVSARLLHSRVLPRLHARLISTPFRPCVALATLLH